jgi:hypothetical protein
MFLRILIFDKLPIFLCDLTIIVCFGNLYRFKQNLNSSIQELYPPILLKEGKTILVVKKLKKLAIVEVFYFILYL